MKQEHNGHANAQAFERVAYRVSEFAGMLGVSRSFLYAESTRGRLEIKKLSGRALILRIEAERYVSANLGVGTTRAA